MDLLPHTSKGRPSDARRWRGVHRYHNGGGSRATIGIRQRGRIVARLYGTNVVDGNVIDPSSGKPVRPAPVDRIDIGVDAQLEMAAGTNRHRTIIFNRPPAVVDVAFANQGGRRVDGNGDDVGNADVFITPRTPRTAHKAGGF